MSTEEARMDPVGGPAPEYTTTSDTGTSTNASDTATGSTAGTKTADAILADELREFGKQIEALFHTARTSTRGQEIESQLTAAWRDVEKGVNTAINKAQSSDLKGTVQGTAQYAADEAQTGLAKGLKNLNQWLAQKRTETEDRRKAREATAASGAKMSEDDVTDRFNSDEPVFGQDIKIPIEPDPKTLTNDNPIGDRFTN
jgi:hypothetical protein